MSGCFDLWDDCIHPPLLAFAQSFTWKGSTVLSKIMTQGDDQLLACVECRKVCPSHVSAVQCYTESHQSEGFLLRPLLVLPWNVELCIPVSLCPAHRPAASSSHRQAIWSWGSFRECQEAGIKSSVPPFQTRHHWGCPAKNSKLSSVYYLWSCVKDSLSLELCATWFSSALWNWATATTWLQPSTCAL